ncbi:MAG: hypothetical protein K9G76_00390 [Bacteroidales bacterium]|nr:hypothetical protein [Bacteroidales bacterium]MCF8402570.1 hypothetical protein [Bacteroidales bacterium]
MTGLSKFGIVAILFLLMINDATSQVSHIDLKKPKGQFFLFWGYNRSVYARSDIHFKSDSYDFTLYDVPAHDLPERFTVDGYLNPLKVTIPQFNARGGFFITNKYAVSAGWDHTKYQTQNDAMVKISGTIDKEASEEYAGTYDGEMIKANHDKFIRIEHSDGLNLIQANIERHDLLLSNPEQSMGLGTVLGTGIIFPMPWTNAKVFGVRNDDRPHFTGLGFSVFTAVKFHFLSRLYLQVAGHAGFVHMPGIVLTPRGGTERASQNIKYLQGMVVLAYQFRLN